MIVPGKTLSEISKILSGDNEKEVLIFFSQNHIMFEFDDTIVVSRLIEGMDAKDILDNGLISAMGIIGEEFKENKIFVGIDVKPEPKQHPCLRTLRRR